MKVKTRVFGEIDIADDKIITLDGGIIGFPDLRRFTILYNNEKGDDTDTILWFQSLDEPQFAMPVIVPTLVKPDYNPTVNDEYLAPLGDLTPENLYVLVTVRVPKDLKDMTVNLKAPIIINTDTRKGAQIIIEDDLDVRFPIYDVLAKGAREV